MNKKNFFLTLAPLEQAFCKNYKGEIIHLFKKNLSLLKGLNSFSYKFTKKNSFWHNKDNLIHDNNYLQNFERRFFNEFYKSLNDTLGVSHPKKYWEIFLGKITCTIIYVLYERWQTIIDIENNHEFLETKILKKKDGSLSLQNGSDLNKNIANSDLFNFKINSEIIRYRSTIKYKEIEVKDIKKNLFNQKNESKKNFFQIKYIKFKYIKIFFDIIKKQLLNLQYLIFNKKNYYIYISPKIKSETSWILRNKFKQPDLKFKFKKISLNLTFSETLRKKLSSNLNYKPSNNFESFFREKIIEMMPLCYLEGYQNIISNNKENKEKKLPKVMFLQFDEIMSDNASYLEWVSYNKIKGSKIFLIQTGGDIFTPKLEIREEFAKNKIYDVLFHYGKKNLGDKIIGAGFERVFFNEEVLPNYKGNIILALYPGDGYSTGLLSTTKPFQDDWNEYLDDKISFLENLTPEIREKIIIRLKKRHHFNDPNRDYFKMEENIKTRFPDVKFNDYKESLNELVPKTSIIIVTHNATTLLETLSKNIPTLMLMDFNKYKLSKTANELYKELVRIGILHFKAASAAEKLLSVWKDPKEWWNSKEVQGIRQKFCEEYAYYPKNYKEFFLKKVSDQINQIL